MVARKSEGAVRKKDPCLTVIVASAVVNTLLLQPGHASNLP